MVARHVEHFCGKRRLDIQVKGRGAGQVDISADTVIVDSSEKGRQDEGGFTCEGWGKC